MNSTDLTEARVLLPADLIEYGAQPPSLCGIYHLDKTYSTFKMRMKHGMTLAILGLRPVPDAIGECSLKTIKVGADNVGMLIRD